MAQTCVCPEGTLYLPEGARAQTVNVVLFEGGQNITISRDRIAPGASLEDYVTAQMDILRSKFNAFNLVEQSAYLGDCPFPQAMKVRFSFPAAPGVTAWQYLLLAQKDAQNAIVFSALYASEQVMHNESHRVDYCLAHFKLQ